MSTVSYSQHGHLADLFDPDLAQNAAQEMADDGTDSLLEHVIEYTPVSYANSAFQRFGGFEVAREPGTLKRSWRRRPVVETVHGLEPAFRGEVYTDDPVAPYVEWNTAPHPIDPKKPGGMLRFRVWPTGQVVFARHVDHPGTTGQHMMGLASARVEALFGTVTYPALQRWAERARAKAYAGTAIRS